MQFKHPEVLWALFLLIIPVIIHLFQLRRFKKTPFTNVAMLQQIVAESRKSNSIKKWLLLLSRLLLLASIILAFAQPFYAKKGAFSEKELVIYLDNSFSMRTMANAQTLMENSVQDLVQALPESLEFSLFTNSRTFKDVTLEEIQNDLLSIPATSNQLTQAQIQLRAQSLFSDSQGSEKNLLVISDLQQQLFTDTPADTIPGQQLVQLLPENTNNVAIDSVYLATDSGDQTPLHVIVSGLQPDQTVPISLYNGSKLIGKTAVKGSGQPTSTSVLSLQRNEPIRGRIEIEDPVLDYDNRFYFNIDQRTRPKVLSVSETDFDFLSRIFTASDFEFQNFRLKDLNYSLIESQNTIVLNGLYTIPPSLGDALRSYWADGGTLVIIPPAETFDLNSYNALIPDNVALEFQELVPVAQKVTTIAFQHPLYTNVFQKEVRNFDYPTVNNAVKLRTNAPHALSYSSGDPFLVARDRLFVFTASLNTSNSNFVNSPLVVPTFYNMGDFSLKNSELYLTLGAQAKVDIAVSSGNDNIFKLIQADYEFIPLQQSFSNKTRLNFETSPNAEGIYAVVNGQDTLRYLSFNYPRQESNLLYGTPSDWNPGVGSTDIVTFFEDMEKDNTITEYWKWFVILALLFAVLELVIQKLFP